MSNWRLIEAELERAMDSLGFEVYTLKNNGDKAAGGCRCGEANRLNVTGLAKALADRMTLTARPVQIKADHKQSIEAQS